MEQHQEDLRWIFEVLKKNRLHLNGKKCVIGQPEVEYLGHAISQQGVAADKEKLKAMLLAESGDVAGTSWVPRTDWVL